MNWKKVKIHLEGDPLDLIEVYFSNFNLVSWELLFKWLEGRITLLECQHGRIEVDELNLSSFLAGDMSYIAHISTENGLGLSLSIIEPDELMIDIEKSALNTENKFKLFLENIRNIARVTRCGNYIVCPEFNKELAFIINGEVI